MSPLLLYPLLKATHVITMVAWFAAVFFLGRMYIYHREALSADPNKDSIIALCEGAEKRILYIILVPSALLTIILGFYLVSQVNALAQAWFHLKLLFVVLFLFYNHYLISLRKKFLIGKPLPKVWQLRLLNEVPFIFLILIVLTVYLKSMVSTLWASLFILVFIGIVGLYALKSKYKK
ncbi:hypothetical protein DID76_04205 [Candidatus Marinamargulisbacteria bacterium SCGC AG-414-C22]|nr:hypothetical protein DID76_04205 [Candidatus Marinamargulisbacteria bacterium SCGC AG-414-C22]